VKQQAQQQEVQFKQRKHLLELQAKEIRDQMVESWKTIERQQAEERDRFNRAKVLRGQEAEREKEYRRM
jgi:hypothetical protein